MSSVIEPARVDVVRQRAVVDALRAFMPGDAVLFDRESVQPYECDGLSAYRQLPMVVALPDNEEQVLASPRSLPPLDVPVVPRGAGTGLSGGALPLGDGVLLSTREAHAHRRDRPARAHGRGAARRAQPRDLRSGRAYGLYYAPDPSVRSPARSAATSPRTRAACTA